MPYDPRYKRKYKPLQGQRLTKFLCRPWRYRPAMVGDPQGFHWRTRKQLVAALYRLNMHERNRSKQALAFWL